MMFFLTTCLLILLPILYLWWYQNHSKFFLLLNRIPGPPGYPIIGNILAFYASTNEQLFKNDRRFAKEYYPIYKEWAFGYGAVNLYNPSDIELVLSTSKHNDKGTIYNFLHAWLGTGLLTSGGAKWQTRRKILTPAFHFSILQEFLPIFNEEVSKLVQELKKGGTVNVQAPITQFTLVSMAETSMGIKFDADQEKCKLYKKAIHSFGYALTYRMLRPWLYSDPIFYNLTKLGFLTHKSIKILHDFSRNVIDEKKRSFRVEPGRKRMAMLDLLLSAKDKGADIDDEGIAEEVDTFMFEGHDTTSVSICYTLLLLANHAEIQQEVYQEMEDILGNAKRPPTMDDLRRLSFMERCIKESLRLFPSVPFISRVVGCDVSTSGGHVVPKGAMAQIHIFDLHRNPDLYPEPDKFDPDRFLPENTRCRHPFAYIPFSAGPRNCIGQKFAMLELKALLCGILGHFQLQKADGLEDVTFVTDLVLRSNRDVKIVFKPR